MVEHWKDSFVFPSQKLGAKTQVQSPTKQCLFVFNTSESGVPFALKLSWDVSQYKNLCASYVQYSHTPL